MCTIVDCHCIVVLLRLQVLAKLLGSKFLHREIRCVYNNNIIFTSTVGLLCYARLNLCDFLYYAIFIYAIIP